ncbi:MAG: hypothetical protein AB1656_18025 [Candidatus Omnitrophota bacterium]
METGKTPKAGFKKMSMDMNISALSQALNAQSLMGLLLTKVMGQAQELVKQQATNTVQQSAQAVTASVEGLGDSVDVQG